MTVQRERADVAPATVGGTLLASLRSDGCFAGCTLAGASPQILAAVVDAASEHQLLPTMRTVLLESGLLDSASAGIELLKPRLESATMSAVAQHLRVTAELAELAPLLEGLGIAWAVVKGPALAELAYPRPELRVYTDLDLLVDPRSFGTVVEALECSGAQLLDRNWTYLREHARSEASMLLRHGTYLDLHWHLVNNAHARANFRWDTAASLDRRRIIDVGGIEVPTLDAEDTLLHVALHAAISGGHRLSWIKDVERLVVTGGFDWEVVVGRARNAKITLPVGVILRRAARLLAAPVPRAVLRRLDVPLAGALSLAAVERLATPASLVGTRHTGQLVMLTARSGVASSADAVAHELLRKFHAHFDGPPSGDALGLSHYPDADPLGRQHYIDELVDAGDLISKSQRGVRSGHS
jgi:hypothetical protein